MEQLSEFTYIIYTQDSKLDTIYIHILNIYYLYILNIYYSLAWHIGMKFTTYDADNDIQND